MQDRVDVEDCPLGKRPALLPATRHQQLRVELVEVERGDAVEAAAAQDGDDVIHVPPAATGCGKSFLACPLANAALRQGHTAVYLRTPRLSEDLARGCADGRYVRVLAGLARVSLLVLDDFLLTPAPVEVCRDLLEVIEDRAERRSTLIASQMPVDKWLAAMADPTLGEAILDRLCQAAHRITLKGPSMRRRQSDPPAAEQ